MVDNLQIDGIVKTKEYFKLSKDALMCEAPQNGRVYPEVPVLHHKENIIFNNETSIDCESKGAIQSRQGYLRHNFIDTKDIIKTSSKLN